MIASFNRVQQLSQDITFIVASVADSTIVEVKDGLMIRPRDNPQDWPLAATDLNPEVPEFVPVVGLEGEEDTAGTDGDDESEEEKDTANINSNSNTPGLVIGAPAKDPREVLSNLLEDKKGEAPSVPQTPQWVEVRKKSKEERRSQPRDMDLGENIVSFTTFVVLVTLFFVQSTFCVSTLQGLREMLLKKRVWGKFLF